MGVKAYELVPVIEQLYSTGDSKVKIECIECSGKELYIGTNFSHLFLYNLEEGHHSGRLFYRSKEILNISLDLKKAIINIKAAPVLKRILVLCDSNVYLMSMTTLEYIDSNPKLKSISTLCVNENPNINNPYAIQICVVKKKRLQILNLCQDRFDLIKDFNIGDVASEVALDGYHICAALSSHYNVFNFKTNSKQELFVYGNENVFPVIKRIGKEEFLVNAPGNLGVFATVSGITTRPPIQWSTEESVLGIAYSHPYILGITEEMLLIYSILDQKQKQVIPYHARGIGNFDGRLLIHSSNSVYGLIPVPWNFQVEMLLNEDKIDEAMELTENASCGTTPREIFHEQRRRLEQRAGFLYLAHGDMPKSLALLIHSHVDPREVISLFPGVLPATSNFVRAVPPLHDFADIEQLFPRDPVTQLSSRHLLYEFLLAVRRDAEFFFPLEIDTALVKLSCELTPSNELDHVLSGLFSKNLDLLCDVDDCRMWLNARAYWHALAMLENRAGNEAVALEIWSTLVTQDREDDAFPGLDYFTEILRNVEHVSLMWRYAELIFSRNISLGVTILTRRSNKVPTLNPHDASEYLQRYPKAQVAYLEHLVFENNIQEEHFHTTLALKYMDYVINQNKEVVIQQNKDMDPTIYDLGDKKQIHTKLRHLLQISNLYRVQVLLLKAREGGLLNEMALLHGKLKEHDKALEILVERLKDYEAAEEYCLVNTTLNENLFHHLLRIYLDPKLENSEELTDRALNLLNAKGDELDPSLVLSIVPENWSVSMLSSFLHASLRSSMHKYRLRKVEAALARGENLQKRFALYDLQRHSILMHPNNYCCICKKPFGTGAFARYPNDVLTHIDCVKNKHICPLTGKNFKTLSGS